MAAFASLRNFSIAAAALALSACATVGQGFDPAGVAALVPGQTTLAQARVLLDAPPTTTYANTSGAVEALWYSGARGPLDAHFSRSVLLAFDAQGRFRRVVNSHNVVLDQAAQQRQLEQSACLEAGLSWPCNLAPNHPPAPLVPPPAPVPVPAPAPAASAGPTGCYAAGPNVTVCPNL